jgi:hypothetical protein
MENERLNRFHSALADLCGMGDEAPVEIVTRVK